MKSSLGIFKALCEKSKRMPFRVFRVFRGSAITPIDNDGLKQSLSRGYLKKIPRAHTREARPPPLRRYGIFATIPTADDEARNRLVVGQISGRNGGEIPWKLGWVRRFLQILPLFEDANGTWVSYALSRGVFCPVHCVGLW